MAKKQSYFAEQRSMNSNPNFFDQLDPRIIRNNVRRIIKDAADNAIRDEDYMYFKNSKIIESCRQESYENWRKCQTIANALSAYLKAVLPMGLAPNPNVDLKEEYYIASTEHSAIVAKAEVWACAYKMFTDIGSGADAKGVLINLTRFSRDVIRTL